MKNSDDKERKNVFKILKKPRNQFILIYGIAFLLIFALLQIKVFPEKFDVMPGDISPANIIATRTIENVIKTIEIAEEEKKSITPAVINISNSSVTNTGNFLLILERYREEETELDELEILTAFKEEYTSAEIELDDVTIDYLLFKMGESEFGSFKIVINEIVKDTMATYIHDDIVESSIQTAIDLLYMENLNTQTLKAGQDILKQVITKNGKIDEAETQRIMDRKYNEALKESKVIIYKGQTFVEEGDTITDDIYDVLERLNMLKNGKYGFAFQIGLFALILLLWAVFTTYIEIFHKEILDKKRHNILVCTVMLLVIIATVFIPAEYGLVVPIFAATIIITILLDLRLGIWVNLFLCLLISLANNNDIIFLFMGIIGGTFAAYITSKIKQRNKLSFSGLAIGGLNLLVVLCFGLIYRQEIDTMFSNSIQAVLNGVVCGIIALGILPIFESLFDIISPFKLLELGNPDQPLLRKLLTEAPGTYHHSLMVGNLAEVACDAIHGDSLLARIGAYYHDIGKLSRPNFFKENQSGVNPHDKLSPNLSSLVIKSHVEDGVKLAIEYKLPEAITDIVKQHHGTTQIVYFYNKALEQAKEDEIVDEHEFRYDGPRPQTKEAAVVMLADTVEAAARALGDKSIGKIEGLVRKLIKDKLNDGQLDLCDITLRDLDKITEGFLKVLSGRFHEREPYPSLEGKIKGKNNEN